MANGTFVKKPIHHTALVVGIIAACVEGLSNIDHIAKQVGTLYDPGVFAAAITSLGAAVLLAFSIKAFNQKHFGVGIGLAICLAFTAAYTMSTTLTRTSEARHNALQAIFKKDFQWTEMSKSVQALSTRTADECGKGAGKLCENNRNAMYLAMAKMEGREEQLDAMGNQVKWMMAPFVTMTTETAGRIQPMFLPVALFLLAMMAVAFGEKGEWAENEFDLELTGKDADEAKVIRFYKAFKAQHGKEPNETDIQSVVKVGDWRAATLLRKARSA